MMMMIVKNVVAVTLLVVSPNVFAVDQAVDKFNQTAGYNIAVNLDTWSNFGSEGGCKTCPYTCIKPTLAPDGLQINATNTTQMNSLPSIYTHPQENGCCYAAKGKLNEADGEPSCNAEANPPDAEDCGFLVGPTLEWEISTQDPLSRTSLPEDPMQAILFASIDCESFWAIGMELVRQDPTASPSLIEGSKVINGGCYGKPTGEAIVLAGCLSSELTFDKSKTYTWEMLARKCQGLSGKCSRTNGLWGQNLKCCTDVGSISESKWDLDFEDYMKEPDEPFTLSGAMIFGIVIGGVALLMLLVHMGAKVHQLAKQTELVREREANEDYDEIVTPLARGYAGAGAAASGPTVIEVSLSEGDKIFKAKPEEVLYEGNL